MLFSLVIIRSGHTSKHSFILLILLLIFSIATGQVVEITHSPPLITEPSKKLLISAHSVHLSSLLLLELPSEHLFSTQIKWQGAHMFVLVSNAVPSGHLTTHVFMFEVKYISSAAANIKNLL